jgi:hypothetical protein
MTNHIPNDLSHLSEAEFNSLCPQGEHAPGPEPLSPAAQAVLVPAIADPSNWTSRWRVTCFPRHCVQECQPQSCHRRQLEINPCWLSPTDLRCSGRFARSFFLVCRIPAETSSVQSASQARLAAHLTACCSSVPWSAVTHTNLDHTSQPRRGPNHHGHGLTSIQTEHRRNPAGGRSRGFQQEKIHPA